MSENEKNKILNEHEMNPNEMKSISGGGLTIDWPAKCKSTVENDSHCWSDDACYMGDNIYLRDRKKYGCSATVASENWCSGTDFCLVDEICYDFCDSNWRIK